MGCFVFVEWFVTSDGGAGAGEVLREGASEMSASAVRLLPEDREVTRTRTRTLAPTLTPTLTLTRTLTLALTQPLPGGNGAAG